MEKIHILLVDDEYFNYEMLSLTLGERYNLSYVSSGREALGYTISSRPDAILLDVCMPGLDGYDTCRLLKNTPETADIPIIMVTGLENDIEKNEAFASGCDWYMTKPFDIAELKEQLEQYAK